MMERRLYLVLGACCAIATAAVGCTGSEGTGDGDDDKASATAGATSKAGSSAGGSATATPAGSAGAPASAGSGVGGSGVGGSGVGGSGGAGSGNAGSGTGGAVGAECVESEPPLCTDDSDIRVCIGGAYETFACEDFCENDIHFEPGPCDTSINDCACGDPLSPECALGTDALCFCLQEAGEPCTDIDRYSYYIACYEKNPDFAPPITCFGEQVVEDGMGGLEIDCAAAAMECLEDVEPAPAP